MYPTRINISSYSFALALGVVLLCGGTGTAHAQFGDSADPIRIESDTAKLSDKSGTSVYTGHVIVTQGKSSLNADRVTVYSKNRAIIKIEALGSPAHFVQQQSESEPVTHAYGKTIIYEQQKGLLTIIDEAKLIQDKNSFTGKRIDYDTIKKVVSAKGGDKQENQRVTIEYFPEPKPANKPETSPALTDTSKE